MSYETLHSGGTERIGPQLSLEDVDFPPAVGERFATLYGIDDPPTNAAEWATAMGEVVERAEGREPTADDLCTTPDGDHAFEAAASADPFSQSYICVLDPLIYPFLTGTPGTVTSTTPVEATTVAFEIREDGFEVSHDDAVISLGVSDHVHGDDDVNGAGDVSLERIYREVCGYVQTFESEDEYETWAADVDAATTPLSATEGVAVGRELATALFDAGEE